MGLTDRPVMPPLNRPNVACDAMVATPAVGGGGEITEKYLRELVRSAVPHLVRSRSRALLVEEMGVCLGRARVDLAVIADRLIGIEIKGPKDDVTRLPHQAHAYSKCFDRVVLFVHETLVEKARPLIPAWWGIVVAASREEELPYYFERRPRPNPDLDLEALLSLLWREEIDALSQDLLGSAAKPRATKRSIRVELCSNVDENILHQASLNKLRERSDWRTTPIHYDRQVA